MCLCHSLQPELYQTVCKLPPWLCCCTKPPFKNGSSNMLPLMKPFTRAGRAHGSCSGGSKRQLGLYSALVDLDASPPFMNLSVQLSKKVLLLGTIELSDTRIRPNIMWFSHLLFWGKLAVSGVRWEGRVEYPGSTLAKKHDFITGRSKPAELPHLLWARA